MEELENRVDIEDLLSRIDLVEYISKFVEMEETNGELCGISPLSGTDTDPSFTVVPSQKMWYDFSAKKGGDILTFIQEFHKVGFKRAVDIACEYLGGDIKELPPSLEATKQIKKYKPPIVNHKEIKYKKLPNDIMTKYDSGLDKIKVWIDEGISEEILRKYQVRYDSFSNRIVFPVWSENGDIINIKGRTLDEDFKQKKIKKYQNYYDIGRMDYFYNLNFAKKHIKERRRVIVFEAEKSVLLAETYGIHHSIALSTSTINDYQFEVLVRLGADAIFCLDNDKDIRDDKAIAKLKKYIKVYYVKDYDGVLGEKDAPIDKGREIFKELYLQRRLL